MRRSALRTDIEGLRAVAVLMVLLFHLDVPGWEGGFAGVDVFFVLSGFLITGLLVREATSTGRIDLLQFYARRARRLMPVALLVILTTVLASWWILPGSQQPDLVQDSIGATLYVVNWVLAWRSVDYLSEEAGVSPFQHFWSLSIEEQFYLVWPLLILLALVLARRRPHRVVPVALAVLVPILLASFIASVLLTHSDPARAYFVTHTRIWQLGAGALLALGLPRVTRTVDALPRPVVEVLTWVGLATIAATLLVVDGPVRWPGTAALLPVLGTTLVVATGSGGRRTAGAAVLGLAPLVWVGGLSYAIYLWHWPLILLTRAQLGPLGPLTLAGLGVLSVLLAWVTKHLVEDPVRFHRRLGGRAWRTLVPAGMAMGAVVATALTLSATRPTLQDSTEPGATQLIADLRAEPWQVRPDPGTTYDTATPIDPDPALAREDVPDYYGVGCHIDQGVRQPRTDCVFGDPSSSTEVLLVGDSKAGQWFTAFDAIARQEGWRLTTYVKSTCTFSAAPDSVEPDCAEFVRRVVDRVVAQETPPELVITSSGSALSEPLRDGMVEALGALQERGTEVLVVQDNYYPSSSRYVCADEHRDDLLACAEEMRIAGGADLLRQVAADLDAPLLDLNPWICPAEGGACPVAIGGQLIWRQGSHLTDTYAAGMTPIIYRELAALGLTERDEEQIFADDVPTRRP